MNSPSGFQPTYEGLKLGKGAVGAQKLLQVSSLPMRD